MKTSTTIVSLSLATSNSISRTKTDLEQSDKCDLRFKSVSETTISVNVLTKQDQKFSGKTYNALFSLFSPAHPSELAIGDSNSNSNICTIYIPLYQLTWTN